MTASRTDADEHVPMDAEPVARPPSATRSMKLRLTLLSFLMLFVELALIRWTGSNVLYLSYFSNFVLLGSFLGIGVGFLRAHRRVNLFPWAPVALALLVAFIRFFPVSVRSSGGDLIYFGQLHTSGPPREIVLAVIFLAVAITMALIGEGVARTFALFEPLEAYKYDLIGSVAGIVGFSLLSFLRTPPLAWGIVAVGVLLALYVPRVTPLQVAAALAILAMLGVESFAIHTSWSPYYKIKVHTTGTKAAPLVNIEVNGVPHQVLLHARDNPLYTTVYEHAHPAKLDNVLVIGAGGGNDVAVALARGAKHVDAVEIDPRIHDLGKSLQPDHAYADPRVSVHINDGRAYLEQTSKRYDLILFALPDSITLVAGQSSLRLESYLFTKEAMQAAKDHLAPGGAFAMYNYYRQQWLIDRYAGTLRGVYGHAPCVQNVGPAGNFAVLMAARRPGTVTCAQRWKPAGAVPQAATDDHPFPYLKNRTLPGFYLTAILLILAASVVLVRAAGGPLRQMTRYVDLFFMGAAFLLLETKNVVQFALLFGTTWFVNALVFVGVLLAVLAAVAVSRRVTFRNPAALYLVLLASLVVAWLVPPSALLDLAVVPRFFAAVALAFTPIFAANLVFTERFKAVGVSTVAFGANLLGAMVGGVLEYMSLVVGYRSLLIFVAVLYGLAFLTGRQYLNPDVDDVAVYGEPASVR